MKPFPYAQIEKKIGYVFSDKALLKEAFTHASYAHQFGGKNNERMEYLGDTVLQLIVTEWQYAQDETATEGKLTAKRQKLVCRDALDSAVDGLNIFQHLLTFGGTFNEKGKAKSSLFEAVTAAIYLDGGYKAAKRFVLTYGNVNANTAVDNPKGDLKEYLEKRGLPDARYEVRKTGRDDSPFFHCTVFALDENAKGSGRTKKEAEATAAARLLWELNNNPPQK